MIKLKTKLHNGTAYLTTGAPSKEKSLVRYTLAPEPCREGETKADYVRRIMEHNSVVRESISQVKEASSGINITAIYIKGVAYMQVDDHTYYTVRNYTDDHIAFIPTVDWLDVEDHINL